MGPGGRAPSLVPFDALDLVGGVVASWRCCCEGATAGTEECQCRRWDVEERFMLKFRLFDDNVWELINHG